MRTSPGATSASGRCTSVRKRPGDAAETVNEASALWTRPRNDIDEKQYSEFYHHVAHAMDDPWMTLHFRAEGVIEPESYPETERP